VHESRSGNRIEKSGWMRMDRNPISAERRVRVVVLVI